SAEHPEDSGDEPPDAVKAALEALPGALLARVAPELAETEDEAAPALQPAGRAVVLYDPLRRYLHELRQFQPLSPEEEHALAVRYQDTQDVDAAYRLVTAHLRLV